MRTNRDCTRRAFLSRGPSEQEVHDELLFHVHALVEDNLVAGMSKQDAWDDAQRRFGSLPAYVAACRPGHGLARATMVVLVAALVASCGLLAWAWDRIGTLRDELAHVRQATVESVRQNTLSGKVLDAAGKPLVQADVLVIVKTWPDGRYRQQAFAAHSDRKGRFALTYDIPRTGPYAVQLAAVKQGYAFESTYQLKQQADQPLDAIELRLASAARCALIVRDELGQPIAGARVVPSVRHTAEGEKHGIYFQANAPVQTRANAAGRTPLDVFRGGERAQIYVQVPGSDWQQHTIDIPTDGGDIAVSTMAMPKQDS